MYNYDISLPESFVCFYYRTCMTFHTLQKKKKIGCFNHWVVILVADKPVSISSFRFLLFHMPRQISGDCCTWTWEVCLWFDWYINVANKALKKPYYCLHAESCFPLTDYRQNLFLQVCTALCICDCNTNQAASHALNGTWNYTASILSWLWASEVALSSILLLLFGRICLTISFSSIFCLEDIVLSAALTCSNDR